MMFKKKIERDKADITLSEFVDRYIKDYFLSVHFEKNGTVLLWVGSRRDTYAGNETTDPSDNQ